jgi:hypothetical protein
MRQDSLLRADTLHNVSDSTFLTTDSLATDSIAADSLAASQLRADSIKAIASVEPPKRPEGLEAHTRLTDLNQSSGIMSMIVVLFVALAVGYKHISRLLSFTVQELWSLRRRANVFDEPMGGTGPFRILLAVQCIVYCGLLLYMGVSTAVFGNRPTPHTFTQAAVYIVAVGAYYLFQLAGYNVVGYTFTTDDRRRQLISGFNASHALLGMTLIIPTLVMIFYPASTIAMLSIAAVLYVVARIIFISKGFRIFYHNFGTLLYFILYLCTLEIIPIIYSFKFALFLLK